MLVKHPVLNAPPPRPYKQALCRYSGVTLSLSKGGSQARRFALGFGAAPALDNGMRIDTLPAREGESE